MIGNLIGLALACVCGLQTRTSAGGDSDLEELLRVYRWYDLPIPPSGAPLVELEGSDRSFVQCSYLLESNDEQSRWKVHEGSTVADLRTRPALSVPIEAIIARGFDAVPALLLHLPDHRLTRTLRLGQDMRKTSLYRVGDLCGWVLFEIRFHDEVNVEAASFRAEDRKRLTDWWKAAAKTPEARYLADCITGPWGDTVPFGLLTMAAMRHPALLAKARASLVASGRKEDVQMLDRAISAPMVQRK